MMTQENQEVAPPVNQNASIMASCLRDFTRMILQCYLGIRVNEDTQDILYKVYKILYAM